MANSTQPFRQGRKKARLHTAKGRSNSSARWLARALNDPYVSQARDQGFRARSAYKLLEIDDRFGILSARPWPRRILDLGAAPGGWSQAALHRMEEKGRHTKIVAADLLEMDPLSDVTTLQLDLSSEIALAELHKSLGGRAGLVLSDMAAATTGHKPSDHIRTLALAESALTIARAMLLPGGHFVCKLFQGGETKDWLISVRRCFSDVKTYKPPASRSDSVETYVIARGYTQPLSRQKISSVECDG